MFLTLVLAALFSHLPSCWNLLDDALRHNAAMPHPTYVSYSERISVHENDESLLYSLAHIDYRDDGIARVVDQRFGNEPFVTLHAEPGPPELGPYGPTRAMWMPDPSGLPTIASLRVHGNISCVNHGAQNYRGHDTYYVTFSGGHNDRGGLKALWIDTHSKDIWKLIISAPVAFVTASGVSAPLADFQVELSYNGPYLVVDHVVWTYRAREYSQFDDFFGEYTMSDYNFPASVPDSYFGGLTEATSSSPTPVSH